MSIWIENFRHRVLTNRTVIVYGNVRDSYIAGDGRLYRGLGNVICMLAREQGFSELTTYDVVSGERRVSCDGALVVEAEGDDSDDDDFASTAPDTSRGRGSAAAPEGMILGWGERLAAVGERNLIVVNYLDKLTPRAESYSHQEAQRLVLLEKAIQGVGPENRLILVSLSDSMIPLELCTHAPTTALLEIPRPDKADRRAYIEHRVGSKSVSPDIFDSLAARTDGMYLRQMNPLLKQLQDLKEPLTEHEVPAIVNFYRTGQKRDCWGELTPEKMRGANSFFIEEHGITGQDEAIATIVNALVLGRSGLNGLGGDTQPKGVYIMAGPTGVGKTMTAKTLALFLYGSKDALCRQDMSELKESHSVSKLIGSPPGYVGYSEGGTLTKAVSEKPFSVVLLDEFEKAHTEILDLFLQVIDEGHLTDSLGQTVSFSECCLIFTTNIGSRSINSRRERCDEQERLDAILRNPDVGAAEKQEQVRRHFVSCVEKFFKEEISRPEILNRIGKERIIAFNTIDSIEVQREMFASQLSRKEEEFAAKHRGKGKHKVSFDDSIVKHLVDKHGEHIRKFGGRGVKNAITHDVLTPLAYALLNAEIAGGLDRPLHFIGRVTNGPVRFETTLQGDAR